MSKLYFMFLTLAIIGLLHSNHINAEERDIDVTIYYHSGTILKDPVGNPNFSAELINQIKDYFEQANIVTTFKATPWSRVMELAPREKNTLIFQMIKTKKREAFFHWLVPLSKTSRKHFLFARNDPELIHLTKEQIISGKYRAVCNYDSAQCEMLKKFGFPDNKIYLVTENKSNNIPEFIIRRRADFGAGHNKSDKTVTIKFNGKDVSLVPLFELESDIDYLTAPKSIDPDLLKRIKAALSDFSLPTNTH